MRIEIDPDKLFDSPYNESMDELFLFDQGFIRDLVQDIKFGNPTCYLVSGYRGAGKSSFIKKVETEIKNSKGTTLDDGKNKPEEVRKKKIIFVHTNFSRYQNQTFLLRKLIRGLYQNLISDENITDFKKLKEDESKLDEDKKIAMLIEKLYEKTFHEVVHSSSNQTKREIIDEWKIDIIELAGLLMVFLMTILNIRFNWLDVSGFINSIAIIGSGIIAFKKIYSLTQIIRNTQAESNEFQRKTLYDDEIADYHFFNVIKGLSAKDFKIVFVLDELDKVEEEQVNNLIKEMKPYLVSGVASFIVVAGQQLYYKYYSSETTDDAPLTTLFSRVIHIPLMSIFEFPALFSKMLISNKGAFPPLNFPNEWKSYVDFLIFKSKRVPRKFINLIHQNIFWENGKAYLENNINDSQLKTYQDILDRIYKIDDKEISAKFSGALRDYYNMQLFIQAEKILSMSSKNFFFTKRDIQ